ncbi:bifunctional DNA-formamidopyrimidine glycosylase/DNA-(apurinic or apyrimidinic site) lyase [Thiomicrorhabdus sp. ZW0627]|uniref:bifunctional DNA-formamidopyrimidine glycosylase/DNA-(apurinic or apyrimidinic site) lyase n=1 Tax=Thiomicrorhabdus sp. ZW0627 TaxID=3039774 RepID=UPI0024368F97|nr:bifunctional DNA-formamidopyrimidine glycosylase/DNA-(apurinic or apyrimidinic site) lyase [Thiomicrorhabdus sp. ZW0627]MDG6773902.1 bifunctional DNA-formamidopyrimidine glycosylase/DNA-(apurinic or apyrimidinic site) lyase [Thiomicrorhabdus sp. ZW0627]
MPELPEVETTRRGIEPKIDRQTITKVVIRNPNLRWPIDSDLPEKLTGLSIQEVARRGKYLLLKTAKGTLLVHLGMSGNLRVLPVGTPAQKHDHVDIEFDNGYLLRLNDPRRFGAVLWHDASKGDLESHERLADLGPEPLSDDFNGAYLYKLSRNRKVAVKSFIMNSHVVVGAGNIYANEALFLSKIHPLTPAQQLTKTQCETLANNIKKVLAAAIEQGGTTLKDFLNADGKPGYFVQKLNVYGRDKQACPVCGTPIERLVLNQRASYVCPKCQPLKRSRTKKA